MSTDSTPGTTLAIPEEDYGLDDFNDSDLVIPRLNIEQKKAVFVDGLSGEEYPEIEVVLLGMVRQRVLWKPEMEEKVSAPLCKSYDGKEGHPGDEFPWKASGFVKATVAEGEEQPALSCAGCALKDWGSHPSRDVPWCTEQHVLPLLMQIGDGWSPAILTLQRANMKASKAYLSSYTRVKSPAYVALSKMSLTAHKRGTVEYATINISRGDGTDPTKWGEYAEQYRSIRSFLHTPRVEATEEEAAAATPPAASAAGAAVDDDSDLPF